MVKRYDNSLRGKLKRAISANGKEISLFLSRIEAPGKVLLKPQQLLSDFEANKLRDHAFKQAIQCAEEAFVLTPWIVLAVQLPPGIWEYIRINVKSLVVEELTASKYLKFKKVLVDRVDNGYTVLDVDFEPYNTSLFPKPTLTSSISNAMEFLYKYPSAKLFHRRESLIPLLDFLRTRQYNGKKLLLNDKISSLGALEVALTKALEYLSLLPGAALYDKFEQRLQQIGLERGWGDKSSRVSKTISLLLEHLQGPNPSSLKKFLGRIHLVFNVVILSPNAGYPDNGGQVVDQVPALEREMLKRLKEQGLDITPRIIIVTRLLPSAIGTICGQHLEKVYGAEYSHVIRVPFRSGLGIVRKWISGFEVPRYMENFTEDVTREITAELKRKPDLIIGDYSSEGNLAVSLLANKLGVGATQVCNCCHSLIPELLLMANKMDYLIKGYSLLPSDSYMLSGSFKMEEESSGNCPPSKMSNLKNFFTKCCEYYFSLLIGLLPMCQANNANPIYFPATWIFIVSLLCYWLLHFLSDLNSKHDISLFPPASLFAILATLSLVSFFIPNPLVSLILLPTLCFLLFLALNWDILCGAWARISTILFHAATVDRVLEA